MDFGITFLKLATKWLTYTNEVQMTLFSFKKLRKMGWILKEFKRKSVESQSRNMGYEILSLCNYMWLAKN
jgi:hypothetical protein